MASDTRDRMIDATVAALRRHGVAGMSFTEILASSGAARGAIYHHFPGGKAQLVAEAAARNGDDVRAYLACLPADSPAVVVHAFLALVRPVVAAAAGGSGCAIAAATLGADPAAPPNEGAPSESAPSEGAPSEGAPSEGAPSEDAPSEDAPSEGAPNDGAPSDGALRRVAADAFGSWAGQLAERLTTAGMAPAEAADLATTLITLLEGAQILCRATGTLDPFDKVVRTATSLVAAC